MNKVEKIENGLLELMVEQWKTLKEALREGGTEDLTLEEVIEKYIFMKVFNEFIEATNPQFDVSISDLGIMYRGVGINELIKLDFYSRMIPDPEFVTNHNRMNPPGEAFMYLGAIPERKGKSDDIEKNFILRTIEAELRVKPGDFYTAAQFISNNDKVIFNMVGDPKMPLDLNILVKNAMKKNADRSKIIALFYFSIFNNDEIFKPVPSTDEENREREYAPFQFLAKYLRSKGYSGIKYRSTVHNGGTNVVIFDANDVQLVKTSMEKIKV